MPYLLKWYPQVRNQLQQAPPRIRREAAQVILELPIEPNPPTAEPLRDPYAGILKIKVDGWRIFYKINEQDRTVTVIAIKRRTKDTYSSIP